MARKPRIHFPGALYLCINYALPMSMPPLSISSVTTPKLLISYVSLFNVVSFIGRGALSKFAANTAAEDSLFLSLKQ